MSDAQHDNPFPGEIRQVGHVVADLEETMREWLALGVGPWTVLEVTQHDADYRGRVGDVSTAIGFSHAGDMQVELIEAKGDEASIWHEARDAGRFGPHHIAYWAEDFDITMDKVARTNLEVVQTGDGNGIARFVYLEAPSRGLLIEIMELNEISRLFMDDIRKACETWDGVGQGIRR